MSPPAPRRFRAGRRALALVAAWTGTAWGQIAPARGAPLPEIRLDVIGARGTTTQLGVAIGADAGTYLRLVGTVAAGATRRDGETRASGRVEGAARFVLDPFAERRWSVYGAGGLALLVERGARARPALVLAIGIEGPVGRWFIPSVEAGLGGGARVGVVLRRSRRQHR